MLFPSVFTNDFDDFFNDFFERPIPPARRRLASNNFPVVNNMRTDIKEFSDSFQIDMQLPGYAKEEVEVSIKDGYLTVAAHHEENKEEKTEEGKFLRKECYRGSCERSFYVGDHIKGENVKATFKDGMLTLTLPKQEALPKEETKQLVSIGE